MNLDIDTTVFFGPLYADAGQILVKTTSIVTGITFNSLILSALERANAQELV